jgi:hypothetical protein
MGESAHPTANDTRRLRLELDVVFAPDRCPPVITYVNTQIRDVDGHLGLQY